MPHPSKNARKARLRKQFASEARVNELQNRSQNLAKAVIENHNKAAYLAKLLAFIVARSGGEITFPALHLAVFPDTAKLSQLYRKDEDNRENDSITLVSVMLGEPEATDQPQIEVITPKIEVVRS